MSRSDALPENVAYSDTGCDLYPECLNCPLPRCRYDSPGGAATYLRQARDAKIRELDKLGLSSSSIALAMGVSTQVVQRTLKGKREDARASAERIRKMRASGATAEDLAALFGLTVGRVQHVCIGVRRAEQDRSARAESMRAMAARGMRIRAIARHFAVSDSTVRRAVARS